MSGELTELYLALLDFIEPLRTRLEEPDALEYLFYRYGWDAVMDDAAFARIQQTATIIAPIEQFATTAEALRPKLAVGSLDAADIETLGQSAATLIRALAAFSLPDLSGLADPFGRADFWESIAEQVFDDLLEQYLRVYQPVIFLVLRLWNVIRYDLTSPAGPGRVSYTRVWFDWAQASSMMTSPLQALEQAYHWGDPAQPFDYEQALAALQLVFQAIRVPAALFAPALATAAPPGDSNQAARDDVLALRMTLLERDFPAANAFYQLGLEIFPAAKSTDQVPTGLMLKPVLEGGASTTLPLNNLLSFTLATAVSADDVIGLAIFPDHTGLVGGAPSIGTSLSLQTTGTGPWYALGTKTSSHIELSGFLLQASIAGSLDDPEIKLQAGFADTAGQPGCTAVVLLSDADPFVQGTVNGSALKFAFSPQIAWSSKTGLLFSGKPTISFDLPLSIALGPISLTDVTLALAAPPQATPAPGAQATPAKGVAVRIGVGVTGTLGPVKVAVSQLGFTCLITPYSRDDVRALPPGAAAPALGAVDVDLQFAPDWRRPQHRRRRRDRRRLPRAQWRRVRGGAGPVARRHGGQGLRADPDEAAQRTARLLVHRGDLGRVPAGHRASVRLLAGRRRRPDRHQPHDLAERHRDRPVGAPPGRPALPQGPGRQRAAAAVGARHLLPGRAGTLHNRAAGQDRLVGEPRRRRARCAASSCPSR